MRSLDFIWRKLLPNGLTQNSSGNSGSRTVMWPATPSLNPNLPKMRRAPASFALRLARSSSTVAQGAGELRLAVGAFLLDRREGRREVERGLLRNQRPTVDAARRGRGVSGRR